MPSRYSLIGLLLLIAAASVTFRGTTSLGQPVFADATLPEHRDDTPAALPPIDTERLTVFNGAPKIVSRRNATDMVHSASVAELADGRLLATWFGGSREGAKDVAIYGAYFDPASGDWSEVRPLITREFTERELGRYIKTA